MAQRDDDIFELRVRAPRRGGGARERGFLARVAVAMGPVRRGKGRGVRPPGARRTAKAGRGAVAAAFAADGLGPRSRRVIVKARLVRLRGGNARALTKHLQYLEREGVTPAGIPDAPTTPARTPLTCARSMGAPAGMATSSGSSFPQKTPPSWRSYGTSPAV